MPPRTLITRGGVVVLLAQQPKDGAGEVALERAERLQAAFSRPLVCAAGTRGRSGLGRSRSCAAPSLSWRLPWRRRRPVVTRCGPGLCGCSRTVAGGLRICVGFRGVPGRATYEDRREPFRFAEAPNAHGRAQVGARSCESAVSRRLRRSASSSSCTLLVAVTDHAGSSSDSWFLENGPNRRMFQPTDQADLGRCQPGSGRSCRASWSLSSHREGRAACSAGDGGDR